MGEREGSSFFERFDHLALAQAELERRGFFFHPVPKEHAEALVTGPLLHRLHTQVKKCGFARVAGHVAITFSGYGGDEREIYDIPEARAYWRALDEQLPELPALLTTIPELRYNGPGMELTMVGEIDAVQAGETAGSYYVHAIDGPRLITAAVVRIRQAGRKYHLPEATVQRLIEQFQLGAGAV